MNKIPYVVDSSVMVKWLSSQDEQNLTQADELLTDVQEGKIALFSPELSKYEIGNVLWKKGLPVSDARETLATYYSLPIAFVSESKELAENAYKIAKEHSITYYDASFLSLTQALEAILITDNFKHQGKVKNIKVIKLADYISLINVSSRSKKLIA